MNSARVKFEEKSQTTEDGRKVETWAEFYSAWANLPGLSIKEQTDVNNRALTNAITLEVRHCAKVKAILNNLKHYRVIYDGKPYTLNSSDPSRAHAGWVRILASRTD